jgi:hypothetical protein
MILFLCLVQNFKYFYFEIVNKLKILLNIDFMIDGFIKNIIFIKVYLFLKIFFIKKLFIN